MEDEKTQDAVVRNFEIIGEAARNISNYHADFAQTHADILWGDAYLRRNQPARRQ